MHFSRTLTMAGGSTTLLSPARGSAALLKSSRRVLPATPRHRAAPPARAASPASGGGDRITTSQLRDAEQAPQCLDAPQHQEAHEGAPEPPPSPPSSSSPSPVSPGASFRRPVVAAATILLSRPAAAPTRDPPASSPTTSSPSSAPASPGLDAATPPPPAPSSSSSSPVTTNNAASTRRPPHAHVDRAVRALRRRIIAQSQATLAGTAPPRPTPVPHETRGEPDGAPATTGQDAADLSTASLPPLLGAPPPSFAERPEAVIGKGGCATVYAWCGSSSSASSPSSPTASSSATHAGNSSPFILELDQVPCSLACSCDWLAQTAAPPLPTDAGAASAATTGLASAGARGPASRSSRWTWSDVPGEWAIKSDPVSYRHAGLAPGEGKEAEGGEGQEGDLDRLGDLLPALLPQHANVLAPQAWWVAPLPPPPQQAPQGQQQQQPGGFKLFTLYRRFECSLWELMHRLTETDGHSATTSTATASSSSNGSGGELGAAAAHPRPRMGLRSVLRVVRDVAAALEHLHAHRVLHADLKPENLLLVLDPQHAQQRGDGEEEEEERLEEGRHPAVARTVLIDLGLARLLPAGVDQLDSKGGTWIYKAPEQMTGPPGMKLAGQERLRVPQVRLESDLWSLGALICWLANDGELRTRPGLPFGLPDDQVAKWGDRPNGRGSQEPFYMLWEDVLPQVPSTINLPTAASIPTTSTTTSATSDTQSEEQERERAEVMALLRRLAQGLMRLEPSQRTPASQVRVAAAQALLELEQRGPGVVTSPAATTAAKL